MFKDFNNYPTATPPPNNANDDQESKKRNILFIVGLIVLIIGVVGYFVVRHNPTIFSNSVDGGDNDAGFIAAFPIWILLFIPFLVAKKKKEQQKKLNKENRASSDTSSEVSAKEGALVKDELNKEQQKMIKLVMIGLILALMFGIFAFFLASR